jgi:CRISPR/Cas system CSM-associated protein Csm3 (group 7 of RAMP superfamily)
MKYQLTAEFQTYWHIGTGRGSGQHLDALVEKDAQGLPYIPGKTIKGLFRDALYKLDNWQATKNTDLLFGLRTDSNEKDRTETQPGLLRFSNVQLVEQAYLSQPENSQLIPHLFQTLASTAIDEKTGSAKDKSLRMTEVVIPAQLHGEITLLPPIEDSKFAEQQTQLLAQPDKIQQLLAQAASLITHIGANKNRGMGRVRLEVKA